MRTWLDRLDAAPRQWPSAEAKRPHPHQLDELRLTYLIDADAFIVHALDSDEHPRLLHIGHDAPEGLTFGL